MGVQAAADAVATGAVKDEPLLCDPETAAFAEELNKEETGVAAVMRASPPPAAADLPPNAPFDRVLRLLVAKDARSQSLGKLLEPKGFFACDHLLSPSEETPDAYAAAVAAFVRASANGSTLAPLVVVCRVDTQKAILHALGVMIGTGDCYIAPMESTCMTLTLSCNVDGGIVSMITGFGLRPPFYGNVGGWSSAPRPAKKRHMGRSP
jgi:hypothetical protein